MEQTVPTLQNQNMPTKEIKKFSELFNSQKFYEAHEVLEPQWLLENGDEKIFLQGLIQAAAAFHLAQEERWGACGTMIQSSMKKLEVVPPRFSELDESVSLLKNDLNLLFTESKKGQNARFFSPRAFICSP